MRTRWALAAGLAALLLAAGVFAGLRVASASTNGPQLTSSTVAQTMPAQPQVTIVTTTSTLPTSDLPGADRPPVNIGENNTPEQFIIGELYKLALQQRGYSVALKQASLPSVAQLALKSGTIGLYPQYLDSWNSWIAHLNHRFPSLKASYAAGSAYARSHGSVLLKPTPFSDTAAIGVTSAYASANHVHSISDLSHGTEVAIGIPPNYQTSPHGLPSLVSAYHLKLGYEDTNFEVGLQYASLDSGDLQAVYINTTDAELAGSGYFALGDPKHVFGFGNVVPVSTPSVLKAEGSTFAATINRVDALLTLRAMRGLNSEVALDTTDTPNVAAAKVAQQFLQGNGILPATVYAPVSTTAGEGS